jgi:hypothetical protein
MAKKKNNKKRVDKAPARRTYTPKLSSNKLFDDLKDMALVAGGVIAGKTLANMVSKGTTAVSGMFGVNGVDGATIQNLIRPVATIGAGLAAHHYVRNPIVRKLAIGVCTYGVIDAVQRITGKNYISGLGNAEMVVPAYQALPQYQYPVMGIDDAQSETITAGIEDESSASITAGVEEQSMDYTAGIESYEDGVIDGLEGEEDDIAITA